MTRNPACFDRSLAEGHITASAWLTDRSGDRVLLTHHRKLERWLQLGGHADGDRDTLQVAITEAREESSLEVAVVSGAILDLDAHVIPARKDEPEHWHFDVRYALVARSEEFQVSEESLELSWVPIDQLDEYAVNDSILRMARKWKVLKKSTQSLSIGR